MKHNLFLLFCLLLICIFFLWRHRENKDFKKLESKKPNKVAILEKPTQEAKMLFVPYWVVGDKKMDDGFDSYVYFALDTDNKGIKKDDDGFKNISRFLQISPNNKNRYLAISMISQNQNLTVLKDSVLQKTIATEAAKLAKENGFNGIVLDFELSTLSFDAVISSITDFNKTFKDSALANNLLFFTTIYGDTFYIGRPYDAGKIAENADGLIVMSYDFSKAKGSPGPNFPLLGKDIYGYDTASMIDDFTKVVPVKKLTFVFGLFGYDWIVDEKQRPKETAKSASALQMKNKFLEKCDFKNCLVTFDSTASANKVIYTDSSLQSHIVWFDDLNAVNVKEDFFRKHGINSFGFWAYSYF